MRKASTSPPTQPEQDDLLPEYRFDYAKSKPNRFATQAARSDLTVVLDRDVAEVFTTPESVNRALRALIEIVPQPQRLKRH
jgi:hypothetical protein